MRVSALPGFSFRGNPDAVVEMEARSVAAVAGQVGVWPLVYVAIHRKHRYLTHGIAREIGAAVCLGLYWGAAGLVHLLLDIP